MKKKKLVLTATGGIAAAVFLTGAGQTVAQTPSASQIGMRDNQTETAEYDYTDMLEEDSQDCEIQAEDSQKDLESEKNKKHILADQGFSSAQIHKIFSTATRSPRKYLWTEDD